MTPAPTPSGPLQGLRVVELAGLGAAPFACMLLADMGAEVLRVERMDQRPSAGPGTKPDDLDALGRGRRSISVDLKTAAGVDLVLALAGVADVFVEGFRPGVVERLGVGPDACCARNPRLVYGRMTGWGQDGPLMRSAGHDIDYIALAGALHPIGNADRPPAPPVNLVGDFGGGGMLLGFGILAALYERGHSSRGQVIDAAMVDGAALLTTMLQVHLRAGDWRDSRESNVIDGAAPYYGTYETADGGFVAVGAVEPQFYAELVRVLAVDVDPAAQNDRHAWARTRALFAAAFATRNRDDWCTLFAGTDACFAPVLSLTDAPFHAHNRARGTFAEVGGVLQPAPAPRFSRTPAGSPLPSSVVGPQGSGPLPDWGVAQELIERALCPGALHV